MIQHGVRVVYRVFDPVGVEGLWYTKDKIQTNRIRRVLIGNDMPMDRADVYSTNNKVWRSSACSIPQLRYWFTHDELAKLILHGMVLGEFVVTEWIELPHGEIIFSEGELCRAVDIADVFANTIDIT